ncbi:alpha-amylase C-terminal beta-sheet domain-containing protein [Chitinimonas sp. BJB300]|uniref:alpha-amylase C-terminal beta-sheet domain-containing protein n=1 Tax=Chitinimonas sp. BJB300 TaxID=1559339 RepID=UPI000C115A8D|nr:alpha-amylase C-terminal beta-sheet domain-containing protein [Chitinimonas sp. BJB300]PHV12497.1 alpha-amylase [Chitinimonas sp. BJB300]
MKLQHILLASLLAGALPGFAATEQAKSSTAVLFQSFHWHSANGAFYGDLQSKAADLKDLGITHVWFPPPSDAGSPEGYLPRQLNKLDSSYGSEGALTSAISVLKAQGIESVADIVINHRIGSTDWGDFTNPTWDCRAVVKEDEWTGKCGNKDSGDGFDAARDIDHSQAFVQIDIKSWLGTRLKGVGFTGIRFDYAKGYAPRYAGGYHDAMRPNFCVGEVWTDLDFNAVDAHRQGLLKYVEGTGGKCGVFDFTTKGLLNQALRYNEYGRLRDSAGKPAGGIGRNAQKMVTFVDNHDTGPSESCGVGQNHWPVPCDKVIQGYAYVLTHPGIPSVYAPHVYQWRLRDAIKALILLRNEQSITSTSEVAIQRAESGLYAAIVDNKVAVKIGPADWSPGAGWTLRTSGNQYAVWTKGKLAECTTVPVSFSIANAATLAGQNLYVVGNQTILGDWTPAQGFKLSSQGGDNNATWHGTVELPPATLVQYKYVKWDGSTASWESQQASASGNREVSTPACGSSAVPSADNFRF